MIVAIDTEYNEVTKIPFICTMHDGKSSVLLYPDLPKDKYKIQRILEDQSITKIYHSATSDIYALSTVGIKTVPPYHDTFIMSNIIDENFASHKLKDLAKKYLHEPCLEQAELHKIKTKYKKKFGKNFRWSMIPRHIIEPYAVKDAEYTFQLYHYFLPKIQPYMDLYNLELDLIPMILSMMYRGHKINRAFCRHEIKNLKYAYDYYYNKLRLFNGSDFNIQSLKQLRVFLMKTGINFTVKTKTGLIKTDKEILEPMAKTNKQIQHLLNCRNALKQINTYYEPLLNEYTSDADDIAHFAFYQVGAKSGRFSAELIQTIPKHKSHAELENNIRNVFIPRDGFINLYFDYNQIEMRLFAHFSNNQNLIDAINSGTDVHDATAMDIFEHVYEQNKKEYRRIAKTLNFGMIYGMGINLLAQSLSIPVHKAHEILSIYDQKYRIRSFISKMTSILYRQGYISLGWMKRDFHVPKKLAYKCVNILIQGSAAYIIKLAMLKLKEILIENFPWLQLLIQLHDELIFEIHKSILSNDIINRIKSTMEVYDVFKVPITVSVSYADKSWGEKKEWTG